MQAGLRLPKVLAEVEALVHELGYTRREEALRGLRETAAALEMPGASPTPDPA